jgi:hypothetical protein
MDMLTRPTALVGDYASDAARWRAVTGKDPNAEGRFWLSVATTGVYCRPGCPARLPRRENVAFHLSREDAERAGHRPCKRCRPELAPGAARRAAAIAQVGRSIATRVAGLDWPRIEAQLDDRGYGLTGPLLTAKGCAALAAAYDDAAIYRSRVVMARHGFGRGEYAYYAYPLPPPVEALRRAAYPPLAAIANRWAEAMRADIRYPPDLEAFLDACHRAGQRRPTPLILRYRTGDYNRLHQDLYGALAFPLQLAVLLNRPGADFEGGEFVLTEQRPRMQSRAEVVPLKQGEGVIFAVNERPIKGARGTYRVKLRHGVSRLRSGIRHTLGIIFHDAA